MINPTGKTHNIGNTVVCADGKRWTVCAPGNEPGGDGTLALADFADFEHANYQIRPSRGATPDSYLFQHYANGENDGIPIHYGTLTYEAGQSFNSSTVARITNTPDAANPSEPTQPYLEYYSYSDVAGRWQYIRDTYAEEGGANTWQLDTYNRMKVMYKPSATATAIKADGTQNFSIGTYTSDPTGSGPTSSNAEVGGTHWYHRYLLKPGVWNTIILDTHPHHERGANGATEHGDQNYWMGTGTGYNYLDSLTRFYMSTTVDAQNGVHDYDDFTPYRETNTESDTVYALAGAYDSSDNSLYVSFGRDKTVNGAYYEIVYAFSDIHTLGFTNATALPNTPILDFGFGGYHLASYETTSVDVSGQTHVYVAVKQQGDTLFRQIKLDLGAN